jgi:hypothetical protein
VGIRKGSSAGLCVVRVTSLSLEEILITVTTKLDVASADGKSCHRFTDAAKAAELVREFIQEWQLEQKK